MFTLRPVTVLRTSWFAKIIPKSRLSFPLMQRVCSPRRQVNSQASPPSRQISRLPSILKKQAIFLRFKKLFTNILTAGAATSPLSSEPPLNGSALLMISRRMLFAPPRMLSGSPNGVRTGFSQWLGSAPIGAFPAKENGAFPFPCFIASIAARKLLITIL